MNVYGTKQIRNVVLLGHGGAGKTTLAEAMALITGAVSRMGKITDGNTISDYGIRSARNGAQWYLPSGLRITWIRRRYRRPSTPEPQSRLFL